MYSGFPHTYKGISDTEAPTTQACALEPGRGLEWESAVPPRGPSSAQSSGPGQTRWSDGVPQAGAVGDHGTARQMWDRDSGEGGLVTPVMGFQIFLPPWALSWDFLRDPQDQALKTRGHGAADKPWSLRSKQDMGQGQGSGLGVKDSRAGR